MAVLSAQPARPALGGVLNPHLGSALSGYAWVAQFDPAPFASLAARPGMVQPLRHFPVAAHGRAISVQRAGAFVDDWYHRIHLSPRTLDLGSIVSTQAAQVAVWNAFFEPRTLADILGVQEGLALSGPGAPPIVVPALAELQWDLSIAPNGPSRLDTTLQWIFAGLPPATLTLRGSRTVAFGFAPDWSEPVTETLEWLTDVRTSTTGAEQRRALRLAPRRSFEAQVIAEGRERAAFDMALAGWGAQEWALPIWHDVQPLPQAVPPGATTITCATAGRDFVAGGLALLRGEDALVTEAMEIAAITAGALQLKRPVLRPWPAGTRLYPVRAARLAAQPEMSRKTDRLLAARVQFAVTEACDWPELAPAQTYRGLPVYAPRPEESEDLTSTFERLLTTLDNARGKPAVTDTAGRGFAVRAHRWALQGVAEHTALRSLLYWLRGRQRACWLPTHAQDLVLAATASGGAITVQRCGYARWGVGRAGRQDIRMELADGSVLHRRILSAAEVDDATETLVLDAALLRTVTPADVRRISYLALMRLADDGASIEHLTDIEGAARAALTFRAVRDDLEAAP